MTWFKPMGVFYRPVSTAGWFCTLLALGIGMQSLRKIDSRSHSASDTLYGVFTYWLTTFLAWYGSRQQPAAPAVHKQFASASHRIIRLPSHQQ
ncbi:MAG: hypothetical protein U0172_13840 [Nitrospiraceae bacterium]